VKSCAQLVLLSLVLIARALAQDLEPQSYSASPIGLNFVVAGFGRSSGAVLVDPNLGLSDVHATLHSATIGYGRTFGLLRRQALFTVGLPYVWGDISGSVGERAGSIRRSGLTDLRARLAVNLHGNPALTPQEFARRKRTLIVGTSLTVAAPSGQYDQTKLINLGTNRFAFKPEVGISYPVKKLDLDAYFGAWLFTPNSAFFPGTHTRRQDPVTTLQGHASYTFRPRLWLAFDFTWYQGGGASLDCGPSAEGQNNTRAGVTFSLPIGSRQSLKLAYSTGTTSRVGTDFDTFAVVWQFSFFDKRYR
jgi:hypothetical protein